MTYAVLDIGDRSGSVLTALRMSLAALSTASSIELACCRADSAPRTESISSPCLPAVGFATSSRPRVIDSSAKARALLGGVDVAGHRGQRRVSELAVELGQLLL